MDRRNELVLISKVHCSAMKWSGTMPHIKLSIKEKKIKLSILIKQFYKFLILIIRYFISQIKGDSPPLTHATHWGIASINLSLVKQSRVQTTTCIVKEKKGKGIHILFTFSWIKWLITEESSNYHRYWISHFTAFYQKEWFNPLNHLTCINPILIGQ